MPNKFGCGRTENKNGTSRGKLRDETGSRRYSSWEWWCRARAVCLLPAADWSARYSSP